MKNIHLIATDKPSKLRIGNNGNLVIGLMQNSIQSKNDSYTNQHVYITNNEEIKIGDREIIDNECRKLKFTKNETRIGKKVILSDDPTLIDSGVQAIPNDFLEWLVKNPSCERVGVELFPKFSNNLYGIILPKEEPNEEYKYIGECKGNDDNGCFMDSSGHDCGCFSRILKEEPKQETIEEEAEKYAELSYYNRDDVNAFVNGAKYQAKRMFSEQDMIDFGNKMQLVSDVDFDGNIKFEFNPSEAIKQFKKKQQ